MTPKFNLEVKVDLKGPGSNAYWLIGTVAYRLKLVRVDQAEIDAFRTRAEAAGSYDTLLKICREYVNVVVKGEAQARPLN